MNSLDSMFLKCLQCYIHGILHFPSKVVKVNLSETKLKMLFNAKSAIFTCSKLQTIIFVENMLCMLTARQNNN